MLARFNDVNTKFYVRREVGKEIMRINIIFLFNKIDYVVENKSTTNLFVPFKLFGKFV